MLHYFNLISSMLKFYGFFLVNSLDSDTSETLYSCQSIFLSVFFVMGATFFRINQSDESTQETPLVIVFHHEYTPGFLELLNVVRFHVVSKNWLLSSRKVHR